MILRIVLNDAGVLALQNQQRKKLGLFDKIKQKKDRLIVETSGFAYTKDFQPENKQLLINFNDKVQFKHMLLMRDGFRKEFTRKGIGFDYMLID